MSDRGTTASGGENGSDNMAPPTAGQAGSGQLARRRQSIVQMELNKQKPKLATKLYPTYTEMPQMWAEVSDTQKQ